ncbi:DMT family transporter [Salinarimonas sp.]|uniref:DMT family transporter n=1 Tax=Salinarimonas sp. TaxID=2766526 RepID=UPI0032D8FFFD
MARPGTLRAGIPGAFLALGALWALGIVVGRAAIASGMPGGLLGTIQIIALGLGSLAVRVALRPGPSAGAARARFLGAAALLLVVCPYMVTYIALEQVTASLMAIVLTTTPLFTVLIVAVLRTEPLTPRRLSGVLLGLVGVSGLIWSQADDGVEAFRTHAAGFLALAFLSPASYAIANVVCASFSSGRAGPVRDAVDTNIVAASLVVLVASFTVPFASAPSVSNLSSEAVWFTALAACANGLASVVFFIALAADGPVDTSTAGYVSAVVAALLGMLFLGETFPVAAIGSAALVLLGVWLSSRATRGGAER